MNELGFSDAISLLWCGVLLALALAATVLVRLWLAGRRDGPPNLRVHRPEVVGYLAGGRIYAADAVVASLHAWGALDVSGSARRTLEAVEPVPVGATPLERAAYAAAPGPGLRKCRRRLRKLAQMDDLATGLRDRGLVVGAAARGAARLVTASAWLPVLLVLTARPDGGTMTQARAFVAIPVVLVGAVVSVVGVPRVRAAGRDVVLALHREGREHAATNGRARFGPGGAGMAVALYGIGAMGLVDPAFARHFVSHGPLAIWPGGSGCGGGPGAACGGGTSCGGSSCGGSSCGGSSCGGSSCGGGGG